MQVNNLSNITLTSKYKNFAGNFGHCEVCAHQHSDKKDGFSTAKKMLVLGGSALGILLALKLIGKSQKINPFTVDGFKKVDFGSKEIITLASMSLFTGVATGIAIDKRNTRDKLKEAMQQMIGNIISPIVMVATGTSLYKFAENKLKDKVKFPLLKETGKVSKFINGALKRFPMVAVTISSLGLGIYAGNKLANMVTSKIFKEKQHRALKFSDVSAHVDDMALGATLVAQNTPVSAFASRLIPPALLVPGYVAGTAKHD